MEQVLSDLSRATSEADLARLAAQVRVHAEMLDEESLSVPHINFGLAQSVADVLCTLIESSSGFSSEDRALVGAAARYFVLTDDESSDLEVDGLIDDATAVQIVCKHVGREDLAALLEH